MLLKFRNIFKLKCLIIFLLMTTCKCDLQQGFTTRCDKLCDFKNAQSQLQLQNDLKPDCQRGCQYFNIQFLINASNKSKVIDLTTTENQCKLSCTEAYVQFTKKDACTEGCKRMKFLQNKAPYINGWLVYMGTPDSSMLLIQPDFNITSTKDNNWISLDPDYRMHEYEKQINFYHNYFTNFAERTNDRLAKALNNINLTNCIPTWKWMIIILMLLTILWLRYVTLFAIVPNANDCDSVNNNNGDGNNDNDDKLKYVNQLTADEDYVLKCNIDDDDDQKKLLNDNNFIVCNETYFYPTPAVPPPKYDEAIEAVLMQGASDADNSATVV